MNIALIFAGGSGTRMSTKDKPKQFLMVHGKPIIVHTIEKFQNHKEIDKIVVVCIEGWIPYMEEMKYRYRLDKIDKIVPGSTTGQLSIYNGLTAAEKLYGLEDNIVLIHDGVRPIITDELISNNINGVKLNNTAVSCAPAKETVILLEDNNIEHVLKRADCRLAKAPQSFWLKDIYNAHNQALKDGYDDMIDSCTMMRHYGHKINVVECASENIKITTPDDFYTFRAIYDAKENNQLN